MSVNTVNSQDKEMHERKDVENSKIKNVFVWFTQTSIGNKILRLLDRTLWIAQKCAEWSLPEHMIDTSSNRPLVEGREYFTLVRPLPWIFFLPSLIFIRSFKMILNLYLLILGYPRITELGMVNFIRINRQHVTKYVKYKRETANKIEEPSNKDKRSPMNEVKQSLIRSIRLTLLSLSCLDTSKLSVSPPPTKIHVSSVFDFKPIVEEPPENPDFSDSDSIHDEASTPINSAESTENSSKTVLDNMDKKDSNASNEETEKCMIKPISYPCMTYSPRTKFRSYNGLHWTRNWFQNMSSDSDSDSDSNYCLDILKNVRRNSPPGIFKKKHGITSWKKMNQFHFSDCPEMDINSVSNNDTSNKEINKEDLVTEQASKEEVYDQDFEHSSEDASESQDSENSSEQASEEEVYDQDFEHSSEHASESQDSDNASEKDCEQSISEQVTEQASEEEVYDQDFKHSSEHTSESQDSENASEKDCEQSVPEQVTEQASEEEVYDQDFEHSSEHASESQDSENASEKDCEQSVPEQVTEQASENVYEQDLGHSSKHDSEGTQDTEDATEEVCEQLLTQRAIEEAIINFRKISEEDKFKKLSKDRHDKTEVTRQHLNSPEKSNQEDDVTFYSPINSDSDLPKDHLMSPSIVEKSVTRDNLETSEFINAENCSSSQSASKIPESKSSDKINNSAVVEKRSGNVSKWHKGKRSGHGNRKRK